MHVRNCARGGSLRARPRVGAGGVELAVEAGAAHRAGVGGRDRRRHGAADGGGACQAPGPAVHSRQYCRRREPHRHGSGGQGAAGRLHAADCRDRSARHCPARAEGAVCGRARSGAGRHRVDPAAPAAGQSGQDGCFELAGIHWASEGQSGQVQLRVVRGGTAQSSRDGAVAAQERHQDDPCPLQEQRRPGDR